MESQVAFPTILTVFLALEITLIGLLIGFRTIEWIPYVVLGFGVNLIDG